jgi:hypothetical protein
MMRLPQTGEAAEEASEEVRMPTEELWVQVQEAVQVPEMQGMFLSHCSPASRRPLLQRAALEAAEEEAREDAMVAKHRQSEGEQEKPEGQGCAPGSHSSIPSRRLLPHKAFTDVTEEYVT